MNGDRRVGDSERKVRSVLRYLKLCCSYLLENVLLNSCVGIADEDEEREDETYLRYPRAANTCLISL